MDGILNQVLFFPENLNVTVLLLCLVQRDKLHQQETNRKQEMHLCFYIFEQNVAGFSPKTNTEELQTYNLSCVMCRWKNKTCFYFPSAFCLWYSATCSETLHGSCESLASCVVKDFLPENKLFSAETWALSQSAEG